MPIDLPPVVLFGAAYYYEYQPVERLKADLDLMAEATFSVIRVGESVWSTWEPEDGVVDLEWLAPVLDGARERGINVLLGTPTYAVPPWLQRRYPEIAAERRTGERIPWGARQEVDYTHPAFRFHAERITRTIVERYAGHPAVIGYQVDNEPGLQLFHNHGVFQQFVDRLRRQYGDVAELNRAWGLTYWSHRLSTWADLWVPDGNSLPQYDLAWRRIQADLTSEFIAWQADMVREYARPDQFVTTCVSYDRPAVEDDVLCRRLDVAAGNAYYPMQDALARSVPPESLEPSRTWSLYLAADRMYASRQEPFLVTETNATSILDSWTNHPAYDGQWRQAAWALISRGARMIEYWHWHTLHFGPETYWGGILPHSLVPGRTYREIARLGAELARAGDTVTDLEPDADVAVLYSTPSRWAMQYQPPLADEAGAADPASYDRIVDAIYRGQFHAGLQSRILHVDQLGRWAGDLDALVKRFPILIAAGLYIASNATLDLLTAYAEAGGHLVIGIRSGYADEEARARAEVAPPRLSVAAGVSYDEYSNLHRDLPVVAAADAPFELAAEARATGWLDAVQVRDAQALAFYEHPHFGRWPAVTTRPHGRGQVTYVGTVPNDVLATALAAWIGWSSDIDSGWRPRPASVTVTSARNGNAQQVWFVHNWSWADTSVAVPIDVTDILSGDSLSGGTQLRLGAWDVRVLVAGQTR